MYIVHCVCFDDMSDADGSFTCSCCHKLFTKLRQFTCHKCLSDYVDDGAASLATCNETWTARDHTDCRLHFVGKARLDFQ